MFGLILQVYRKTMSRNNDSDAVSNIASKLNDGNECIHGLWNGGSSLFTLNFCLLIPIICFFKWSQKSTVYL